MDCSHNFMNESIKTPHFMDCRHNFMNESIKTPHFMDSQKGLPPQPQYQTLVPGLVQKYVSRPRH